MPALAIPNPSLRLPPEQVRGDIASGCCLGSLTLPAWNDLLGSKFSLSVIPFSRPVRFSDAVC